MEEPLPSTVEARRRAARIEMDQKAEQINNDDSLDEVAKIDALAELRHWFSAENTVLDAYLADRISLSQAVDSLADPIDEAYSTGDHGMGAWNAERIARSQRKLYPPEEALRRYGPQEDIPHPGEEAAALQTTGNLIWDMWLGLAQAGRRIPWTDAAQQDKLLRFVQALRARPDPPLPEGVTAAMRSEWTWQSGKLWSELHMLSMTMAEVCNETPGCASGWTPLERRVWHNLNAFMARLTVSGACEMDGLGAVYTFICALESRGPDLACPLPMPEAMAHYITELSIWISVAGRIVYGRRLCEESPELDKGLRGEDIPLDTRWRGELPWGDKIFVTDTRWTYWHRILAHLSHQEELDDETRAMAERTANTMISIQSESKG